MMQTPDPLGTSLAGAMNRVLRVGAAVRSLLIIEGDSDRAALRALAARLGRDLDGEGVATVVLGGATNLGHLLHLIDANEMDVDMAGLCDANEEASFRLHLQASQGGEELDRGSMERLGFFVCHADLEDELISSRRWTSNTSPAHCEPSCHGCRSVRHLHADGQRRPPPARS